MKLQQVLAKRAMVVHTNHKRRERRRRLVSRVFTANICLTRPTPMTTATLVNALHVPKESITVQLEPLVAEIVMAGNGRTKYNKRTRVHVQYALRRPYRVLAQQVKAIANRVPQAGMRPIFKINA